MKNIPLVDLKKQYISIKKEIDSAIQKTLNNAAFIKGEEVYNFEKEFAKIQDVKFCIGVANGTDALIIALKSLGIGIGDEVIVPANSFIASSEAVTAVGARVVFVDVDKDYYTIDTKRIENAITKNTKAIIAVHLYGQPADLNAIKFIADKYKIKIIEDAAQAHLAEYKDDKLGWKKIGNVGDISTFSFYPGKNLGAYGDGGAIVTNDEKLSSLCNMYANHGRIAKYNHEFEGYNSRLDGIQAAVLNVKLQHIIKWTERRNNIANKYLELLNDCSEITLPKVFKYSRPVWHLFVIRTENREKLQDFLNTYGISSGIHYPIALPNLKAYSYLNHSPEDFPISSKYQDEIMSLPLYPEMTDREVEFISETILKFFHSSQYNC